MPIPKAQWIKYDRCLVSEGGSPFIIRDEVYGVRLAFFETGHGIREFSTLRTLPVPQFMLDVEIP